MDQIKSSMREMESVRIAREGCLFPGSPPSQVVEPAPGQYICLILSQIGDRFEFRIARSGQWCYIYLVDICDKIYRSRRRMNHENRKNAQLPVFREASEYSVSEKRG